MADTPATTTTTAEGTPSSSVSETTPIATSASADSSAASTPSTPGTASPIAETANTETQPSAPSSTPTGEKKAPLSSAAKQKYLMATRTNQSPKRSTPAASVLEKVNAAAAAAADAEASAGTGGSLTSLTPISSASSSGSSSNIGEKPPSVASMKELASSIKRDSGTLPASASTPAASAQVTSSSSLPTPLSSVPPGSSQEKLTLQASASDDNRGQMSKEKSPRRAAEEKKAKKEEKPKQRIEKVRTAKDIKKHKAAESIIRNLQQKLRDEKSLKRYLQNQLEDVKRGEQMLKRKLDQLQDATIDAALLFPTELSGFTTGSTGKGLSAEEIEEQVGFTRDQFKQESGNARETFYDVTRCLHDKAQIESELKIARRNLALSGFRLIKKKNEPKNKPQNTQETQNEEKSAIAIVQQAMLSEEAQVKKMQQVTTAREKVKAIEAERAKIAEDFLAAHARIKDRIQKTLREKETAEDEMALIGLELVFSKETNNGLEEENKKLRNALKLLVRCLPKEVELSFRNEAIFAPGRVDEPFETYSISGVPAAKQNSPTDLPHFDFSTKVTPKKHLKVPLGPSKDAAYNNLHSLFPEFKNEEVIIAVADIELSDSDYWKLANESGDDDDDTVTPRQLATPRLQSKPKSVLVVNTDGSPLRMISPRGLHIVPSPSSSPSNSPSGLTPISDASRSHSFSGGERPHQVTSLVPGKAQAVVPPSIPLTSITGTSSVKAPSKRTPREGIMDMFKITKRTSSSTNPGGLSPRNMEVENETAVTSSPRKSSIDGSDPSKKKEKKEKEKEKRKRKDTA